jgi:hypothetical protein
MVGDPIAFQVSLPEGWARQREDEVLYVLNDEEDFIIMVAALDLVAMEEDPLPMPEPEFRRILTTMVMGSDSLLLQIMEQSFLHQRDLPISDLVQEIGTLGGERAARLSARVRIDDEDGWFRVNVTMRDGVMYMLGFLGRGEITAEHEPLIGRIHESFALAGAPPAAASRTSAPTGSRRIKGSH